MVEVVTAIDLAAEVGETPKRFRAYLRNHWAKRLVHTKGERWIFTCSQADKIKRHYLRRKQLKLNTDKNW